MKKILVAVAAMIVSAGVYAQGTVNFNNRVPASGIDAPVVLGTDATKGPGVATSAYVAQLFLVNANGSLTALTPTVSFRNNSDAASKYINPIADPITVPGIDANGTAKLRMRVYAGASYDTAPAGLRGESNDVTVTLGGGPVVPADLVGLTGFTVPNVVVPEPTTLALGALGLGALLIRRRK